MINHKYHIIDSYCGPLLCYKLFWYNAVDRNNCLMATLKIYEPIELFFVNMEFQRHILNELCHFMEIWKLDIESMHHSLSIHAGHSPSKNKLPAHSPSTWPNRCFQPCSNVRLAGLLL